MKLAAALFIVPALIAYIGVMTYLAFADYRDRRGGKTSDDI